MVSKIGIVRFLDKYPKVKKSSVSLHFLKNNFKVIKGICKENASEQKYLIKICLKVTSILFAYSWLAVLVHYKTRALILIINVKINYWKVPLVN